MMYESVVYIATSLSYTPCNRDLNPSLIRQLAIKKKEGIEPNTRSHTQAGLIPNTGPQLTGLALQYL